MKIDHVALYCLVLEGMKEFFVCYFNAVSNDMYHNPKTGLKTYILSKWNPQHNYQGWVNTMHGGILSTLIDEVCGWVVTRKLQTSGYTVQLNVKFRKAVPTTEPELTIRAKVAKQVRNLAYYLVAEIVNILCDEKYLAEDGKPDVEKMELITFDPVHHTYIQLGKTVGNAFSDGKQLK